MKRKIEKYLNSKKKSEYDNLDKIFELYLFGNIETLLSEYSDVRIYPTLNRLGKAVQLNYNYHNIYVVIDFFENKYNAVIYHAGIETEELEKLFIDYNYQDDFNIEELIKEIDNRIKNHSKLKYGSLLEKRKNKKLYSAIACISMCLSIVVCGSIALYCFLTGNVISGNVWWVVFIIIIPLIFWFIFDVKSKR